VNVDEDAAADAANDEREPCVSGVHNFHTALLFSIETQHTIGYGTRLVGSACPGAATTLMVQSCVGFLLSSLLAGLTYAKLARPVSRGRTVIFSRRAVVCRRDGVYCLLFRVGDVRRSHIVGVSIRALIVRWRRSPSGMSLHHYPMKLETETGESLQMLMWPETVVHRITSSSPLWNVSADQLRIDRDRLEIIVVLQVCK
jgi:potassium inwardly-rectifying channel subfamily J, other